VGGVLLCALVIAAALRLDAGGDGWLSLWRGRAPAPRFICIEASRPVEIKLPFEVTAIGEKAERGLWIGPQLAANAAGGGRATARYAFYAPRGGRYTLWMYCLWHGQGHNTVMASVDAGAPVVVGGDAVNDAWHWVAGPSVGLSEGAHSMTLEASNDNLAVRKALLAEDDRRPEECGVVLSEIFHDDFDGCTDGNFGLWKQVSGDWRVVHPGTEPRPDGRILAGKSQGGALIMLAGAAWRGYMLRVSCRTVSATSSAYMAGVCLGLSSANEYHVLRWRELPGKDEAAMQLVRQTRERSQEVASFNVPWAKGAWHDIDLEPAKGAIGIAVDYGKKRVFPCGEIAGGVGLWMAGYGEAQFDNVEVLPLSEASPGPSLEERGAAVKKGAGRHQGEGPG